MNINEAKFALKNGLVNPELTEAWIKKHKPPQDITDSLENCIQIRVLLIILIFVVTVMTTISITISTERSDNQQLALSIVLETFGTTIFLWLYRSLGNHEFVTSLSKLQKLLVTYAVDRRGAYLLNRDDEWLKRNADDILQILANALRECEAEDVGSNASIRRRALFKDAHATCFEFELCQKDQGKWLPKNPPLKVAAPTETSTVATATA